MTSYSDWRKAYALQAQADLKTRERLLEHPELPACQQLHFLQMACEKICKAYLCGQQTDPEVLQSSHAYVARVLPLIVRQHLARQFPRIKADRPWVLGAIRKLARKIELLAPAVRAGGTHPANCEYPWVGPDGAIRVPAQHNFQIDMLYEEAGRRMMKALYAAVIDLSQPDA